MVHADHIGCFEVLQTNKIYTGSCMECDPPFVRHLILRKNTTYVILKAHKLDVIFADLWTGRTLLSNAGNTAEARVFCSKVPVDRSFLQLPTVAPGADELYQAYTH